jgi:hypothetical protein
MTEYERLVKEGKMPPMNGLDGLFIGSMVEDILNDRDNIDDELLEAIEGVYIEIEYLFREEQEKLDKLNIIIREYKSKQDNGTNSDRMDT